MEKKVIIMATLFGSIVGTYLPTIFGVSSFSFISVVTGALGGILGIWLSFRFLS